MYLKKAILLLILLASVGYIEHQRPYVAHGTDFTVGDAASLIAAINEANNEIINPGVDTINLTSDILLTSIYYVNDPIGGNGIGLPSISSEIVINGNNFAIRRDYTTCDFFDADPDFRILDIFSTGVLTLNNIKLQNECITSTYSDAGAGLYNVGIVILNSSIIENNRALNGGGFFNTGYVILNNSQIINNQATSLAIGSGGGFLNFGDIEINDSLISGNTADSEGGAFSSRGFNTIGLLIRNSIISNNEASWGAGMSFNGDGDVVIEDSQIINNISSNVGGGIALFNHPIVITRTLIQGNSAAQGGAIYLADLLHDVNITDTRILNNSAGQGGAIYLTNIFPYGYNGPRFVNIANSCIVDNTDTAVFHNIDAVNPMIAITNWWGALDGPSGAGNGHGDSVSPQVDFGNWLTTPLSGCPDYSPVVTVPTQPPPVEVAQNNPESSPPSISLFDPALSKIGLLVPGQVGVTGEQLQWLITVTNNGNATGTNIQITDVIDNRLQVDRIEGAAGVIAGQTVIVTIPSLAPGQSLTYSIFTTVLRGVSVENTVCLTADQRPNQLCTTGFAVQQLPATGASPWWRLPLLMLALSAGILTIGKRLQSVMRIGWLP